jgi:general secretion pathway protein D
LVFCSSQLRVLALPLALGLSACQTFDDAPVTDSWNAVPSARVSGAQARLDRSSGALLLANTRGGDSTVIEGSGRFVGEPPTGAIGRPSDEVADGVTLNLVNVPAPQAAKTILGDILGVKYTVDPGIEGKITIQTPKPVARSAVIDLFQAALRSNNAALVNRNGSYRIVPSDQAIVGAASRPMTVPMPATRSAPACRWCSSDMSRRPKCAACWRPSRRAAASSAPMTPAT